MVQLTNYKAIDIAVSAALQSNMRMKLGAVLYDRSKHVVGFNRGFGVEVTGRERPFSIHAEEMAILKGVRVGIDFNNSTLCVVRINREGMLRCSRPCGMCSRLIEKVGIRQVWYVKGSS